MTRVPLKKLKPASWNPRIIRDERFKNLCRSIEAHPGLLDLRPILATKNGTIFGGNKRYRAVEHLGWTDVPATLVDIPEQLAQEYALIDNGSWGEWKEDDLGSLLAELKSAGSDIDLLGFDSPELDRLLASVTQVPEEDEADLEPPAEPITKPGDLWLLGEHRLLCGDSTNITDVERLMNGERAVLFSTDPPYLVDYDGTNHPSKYGDSAELEKRKNKDWREVYSDCPSPSKVEPFYDAFVSVARAAAITESAAWYCWHGFRVQAVLEAVWRRQGVLPHQQIVWVKDRPILSRVWYMWKHETCFFGWLEGHKPARVSNDYPASVWEVPGVSTRDGTSHPTEKPMELFAIPMRQHTNRGDLCYEPFSGSGTQILAAEELGRRCFAMDAQPAFVDVAVNRWQKLTGKKAVLDGAAIQV